MQNISLSRLLSAIVGGPKYPTKEQIVGQTILHKKGIIAIVKRWKKENWKTAKAGSPRNKFDALKILIEMITAIYGKPVNVEFVPELPSCCYNPQKKTISVNASVSIISALHELAHHLFDASELKACRWSIWLFKKTFPIAYSKLIWNQHLLIKPTPTCPTHQIESPSDSTTLSE